MARKFDNVQIGDARSPNVIAQSQFPPTFTNLVRSLMQMISKQKILIRCGLLSIFGEEPAGQVSGEVKQRLIAALLHRSTPVIMLRMLLQVIF